MDGVRVILAIVLSVAVIVLTNLLFPPVPPQQPEPAADTLAADTPAAPAAEADTAALPGVAPVAPPPLAGPETPSADTVATDTVVVESPLARYGIASRGGSVVSLELLRFESFTHPGAVQLVEPGADQLLGYGLQLGERTLDLDAFEFRPVAERDSVQVERADTLRLLASPAPGVEIELAYAFHPDRYVVDVQGEIRGADLRDATLLLRLGPTLAINESDSAEDRRALAYVVNSRRRGIESVRLEDVEGERIEEGPLRWFALKNKYFVAAALSGDATAAQDFGGVIARDGASGPRAQLTGTLPIGADGGFAFRLFFGPQDYGRLAALGQGLEDVNPYGWRLFRPIIRPLAHLVTWLLVRLQQVLQIGYGWVLILFGVVLQVMLWPLYARATRSQLKTMELQPRIKEMQEKYKEDREKLQKEMMRLYKEEGFNPLGGCLPMFLPWPILITLFFVFQNTIEFRGVDFLWLPDLSRPDPLYILPLALGLSIFLLQFMSMRTTKQANPQMKLMMYFMPVMMVVIFLNFASGLNLYYAASNVASLPRHYALVKERQRAQAKLGKE